ncbi:RING-H2 finger protein ATL74-like [Quercus lobata]|uniref:RING-H2 finger protein ATL74-like n=1 Tax=Quercus lobata TaxID=97700 RepID=UPI0012491F4D|nr:RING-H2 finger protein ATL74-like [Quercus lobata]
MSPPQAHSHSSASGSLICPTHHLLRLLQPPASIPICPFKDFDMDDAIISLPFECEPSVLSVWRYHYVPALVVMTCVFALIMSMLYVAYHYGLIRIRVYLWIPVIVFHDGSHVPYNTEKCCICLHCFVDGDELSSLPPCRHVFHHSCIAPYLALASTCPYCRGVISFGDD